MTFSMKKRIWKFNVNLLQSSTFTHSEVMKKEVKGDKAIRHLITKKICDPNTPFYCYISYFLIADKRVILMYVFYILRKPLITPFL